MLRVIRLTEDIVFPVLNPRGIVVPIGALVARLVVDVYPNLWRRGDEHLRGDSGDWAWPDSGLSVSGETVARTSYHISH